MIPLRTVLKKIIWRTLPFFLFSFSCYAQEIGGATVIPTTDPTRIAQIQAELSDLKPEFFANTSHYWDRKLALAMELGDIKLQMVVIDAAIAQSRDIATTMAFKRFRWKLQAQTLPLDEALVLGDELHKQMLAIDHTPSMQAASIANFCIATQNIDCAREWITKAQKTDMPSRQYGASTTLFARSALNELTGNPKEALALVIAAQRVLFEINPAEKAKKNQSDLALLSQQLTQKTAELQISLGMLNDAEKTIKDIASHQDANASITAKADLLVSQAKLNGMRGQHAAALLALQNAERLYLNAKVPENTLWIMEIRAQQIATLNRLERFSEAAALALKQRLAGGAERANLIGSVAERALAFAHIKAWGEAVSAASEELRNARERYGNDHYFTLRATAVLRAVESASKPQTDITLLKALNVQLTQARSGDASSFAERQQQRLVADITSTLMTNGFTQNTIATPTTAANAASPSNVSTSTPTLTASTAARPTLDAAAIATLFASIDRMRPSAVGEIVATAARNAASKQAGLAPLLQKLREIEVALKTGYDNLGQAMRRGKGTQDESVLINLRDQVQKQQQEQVQLEREVARRFPEYLQLSSPEAPQLGDVVRLLSRNEVLAAIMPRDDSTLVWILTRDRAPLFYTVPLSEAALRTQVAALRKGLDIGDQAIRISKFDTASARSLYTALLGPARELLAGRTELIVNAAGPLGQIPFGALVADETNTDKQNTAWLARTHAVSHIASIGAFASLRQSAFRAAATKPFIGFGDPLFARNANPALAGSLRNLAMPRAANLSETEQLAAALKRYDQIPPLPETRDEILSMAAALGADKNADVFLGRAASREAVLRANLADYQVISFSTHGLMAGDLPGLTQPALAMAATDKDGDNPLLLLEDVMSLKLNADWVVLSACNTAAADGEASEALSGLARGFFYAGARSLLVTHWAVESASAQMLMTETFKRYAANKSLSRAEALRQAQLELMRNPKYAHPFFWAPYALVGDGG